MRHAMLDGDGTQDVENIPMRVSKVMSIYIDGDNPIRQSSVSSNLSQINKLFDRKHRRRSLCLSERARREMP